MAGRIFIHDPKSSFKLTVSSLGEGNRSERVQSEMASPSHQRDLRTSVSASGHFAVLGMDFGDVLDIPILLRPVCEGVERGVRDCV